MLKGVDIQYLKHFLQFAKKYKRTAFIGIAMLPLLPLSRVCCFRG